jgi:hypothetical protein
MSDPFFDGMAAMLEHAHKDQFSRERLLHLFTGAPDALWRFDVDISLPAAVRMARFAEVAGIQGTFFLNPRCHFYNLLATEGQDAIEAIRLAGHTLGLHCDYHGRYLDLVGRPVQRAVAQDYCVLKAAGYGDLFTLRVSFHMPGPEVLWIDYPEFENAYAARWEGHYVSDSRGRPIEREVTDDMQVCLHPEHWQL